MRVRDWSPGDVPLGLSGTQTAFSARSDAPFDAASERLVEGSVDSGVADANQMCRSLDAFCSRDGSVDVCVRTWQAAQSPSKYCRSANDAVFLFPNCEGFNVVRREEINFPEIYFYDASSSALVGVVIGGSGWTCYGKPGPILGFPVECLDGPAVSICKADAH